jgi:hypothetical protein
LSIGYTRYMAPETTVLDTFPDLGALSDSPAPRGESIISPDDMQELTNILTVTGIPATRGRE